MNKQKLLTIAVLGLLLLNVAMVSFFILRKPPHSLQTPNAQNFQPPQNHKELKETVIETLKFDEEQIEKYEELVQQHRDAIHQKDSMVFDSKMKLYSTLADNNIVAKDSVAAKISLLHNEIEAIHYNHFEAIKALCKPEQLPLFKELSKDFAEAFKPKQKPPHQPPPHPEEK